MDLVLSLLMLSAFALTGGALVLFRRGNAARQAWLMLVAAAVLLGNAVIWALPLPA